MICSWKEFLQVIPPWMRQDTDRLGKVTLQELRLRINAPPELVLKDKITALSRCVSEEDLKYCVNMASKYSPWAATSIGSGYLTAPGGHRIGVCGEAVMQQGIFTGLRYITSVCIRVARDFPGIASNIPQDTGSVLILGAPGWGKTTLLRDLVRKVSQSETVCVVDERGELFPEGIPRGRRMDVMTGCPKPLGIYTVLRTMGPSFIAVDEITAQEDAQALISACGCGVHLLATAHAFDKADLSRRKMYRELLDYNLFNTLIILKKDKSYHMERILP